MNYHFFASKVDKVAILDHIFNETDLQVFDLASAYGEEVVEYTTVEEITSKFDLEGGGQFAATFNLWTPRHKGKVVFRKIELDPNRCQGFNFRFRTEGWGLIQLYFAGIANHTLRYSHIGHFSEKGALKWESDSLPADEQVNAWDWTEVLRTSRKLKYELHKKLAIRHIGSMGVLEGADAYEKAGGVLR